MPPKRSRLQSSSDSDSDSAPLISSFASSKRPHQAKKSRSNPLSFSSNPSKSQSNAASHRSTDQHRTVDDDDDFFVFIGTEFPDLSGETSKKNQDQSHLPVWQQDVRDEKGRKRLHGAFKGGFSAGYFNTVGSKEGWTPSTFVSSRSSRKEQTQLRPEDFMDEEDLEEIRNEKQTTATSTFSLFTSAPESQIGIGTEPAVGDGYLSNLVAPTSESMGTKIMKNMGWKPGQGLGPLVLIDVPTGKLKTAPKEDSARYLYSFQFQPKVDSHGLGFQAAKKAEGLQGLSAIAPGTTGKGSRALPAGAIGTGILNDFDPYEDSMDAVYSGVDLSQYDIAMNDADDREKQYLDRKAKAIADRQQKSEQNVKAREKTKSTTGEERTKICSDGKNVLNGFVLADKASELTKWYFPPTLPPNWTPKAKIAVDAVMSKVGAKKGMSEEVEHDKSKPPEKLTVEERAAILGDPSVPVSQRSVFSFISAKDKARLHTLAAQKETPAAQEPKQDEWSQFKSIVTPELARTALKSHFVKTMADVGKRERLIQFLKVNAKEAEDLLLLSDRRAQQQEFEEFVRLVRMFQPMSLGMASRFTSGSVLVGHNEQNAKPDGSVSEKSDADMLRKDLDKEDVNMKLSNITLKRKSNFCLISLPLLPQKCRFLVL
ncbi:hypothetical protein BKA69DRAFT_1078742 [Paraphysoderma sedebokerense]|nr:hypothetical protein BKA69DRAFT_1078742 [Paraphysoderma sedebokerense]